jgi:hypothetical protein
MFDYQTLPKHHLKSQGTHSSTPILLMCLVLSMEATLFALQPLLSVQTPAIAKASSHKIASSHVGSIYGHFMCLVDGRGQQLMRFCTMTCVAVIYAYLCTSFILLMLALVYATNF